MGENLRTIQQPSPMLRLEPIMLLPALGTQPHHAGTAHVRQRSLHGPLEAIHLARELGRMRRLVREEVEHRLAPNINAEEGPEFKGKIGLLRRTEFPGITAQP